MSSNHYKYACSHCSTIKTAAYMVRHIVDTHPESFEAFRLRGAFEKSKSLIYDGLKKNNEKFTAHCCIGCNRFYHKASLADEHFANCPNKQKHNEKCKELYDNLKSDNSSTHSQENEIAIAASKATMEELERLRKENALLKQDKEQQQTVNELAAKLVKAEKINEIRLKQIKQLEQQIDQMSDVETLQSELEDAKKYEYLFHRLRYHILIGQVKNDYGQPVPLIPYNYRQKLIECLESDKLLPLHKEDYDTEIWGNYLHYWDADPDPDEVKNQKYYEIPDYPVKESNSESDDQS